MSDWSDDDNLDLITHEAPRRIEYDFHLPIYRSIVPRETMYPMFPPYNSEDELKDKS